MMCRRCGSDRFLTIKGEGPCCVICVGDAIAEVEGDLFTVPEIFPRALMRYRHWMHAHTLIALARLAQTDAQEKIAGLSTRGQV